MPIGPFGEVLGTTGTLDMLSQDVQSYKSRVVAPKNPKLVKHSDNEKLKLSPSQYLFQMSMSTEQKLSNMHTISIPKKIKLLDMSDISHQKVSSIAIDISMFQPYPSEIFFQNYKPFEIYEVPFQLRNNDKVPRLVKVSQQKSPYFKIIAPNNVGHKVGPGLATTFLIQFTAEENKDYFHELLCVTEREKFVVPVRAIGARAIVDFPDEVIFDDDMPVKHCASRTLLVRNVGQRTAKFTIEAESPYSVPVSNYIVEVEQSLQVTIDFTPTEIGSCLRELKIHYDTDEYVYVNLRGGAINANIRLDRSSVCLDSTYITMANQRSVTLTNRSKVIAHFKWSRHATTAEEQGHREIYLNRLDSDKISEHEKFIHECIEDPSLRDKISILSRNFQNKKQTVLADGMVFTDEVWQIQPSEGELWPNSSVTFTAVFRPLQATLYQETAFCEVTGRESRLPLKLQGQGIGPQVKFSHDSLDIGNVFVNSSHVYEIIMANTGDIDAIYSIVNNQSKFSACFTFNPSEAIIMPDGHQAIRVTFTSSQLGDFVETVHFEIDGRADSLNIEFSGTVIGPTFHFDVPKLIFGTLPFGFVSRKQLTLHNTSLIPMIVDLRVPGDGSGPRVTHSAQSRAIYTAQHNTIANNKQFHITPAQSSLVDACSSLQVIVDFCPAHIRQYDGTALVVDVQGIGNEILRLPIVANCIVPEIIMETKILDFGRCFINHPYEHIVKLRNTSEYPTKYALVSQTNTDIANIYYGCPEPTGTLEPLTTTTIPLVVTPQAIGDLREDVRFQIFGSPHRPLRLQAECIGEGPVVHVTPPSLDWGETNVLVENYKELILSNESLIPAMFSCKLMRSNSVWRLSQTEGEIGAEQDIKINICAVLNDCVKFSDRLLINIENSGSHYVNLTAIGTGTTIVVEPSMSQLHLGPHFSHDPIKRYLTMTNLGRRHQSLVWSTEGFAISNSAKRVAKQLTMNGNKSTVSLEDPVFTLTPSRLELNPGKSTQVLLEAQVNRSQLVNERMLCHSITGRTGGKELIMKVNVNCQFIDPIVTLSENQLAFRIEKEPNDELEVQTKSISLKNASSLPLSFSLNLDYPFNAYIGETHSKESQLSVGESETISVTYDPRYKNDCHSRIIEANLVISYAEHPHKDVVGLRGEVHYPNLLFEKSVVDFGCILNDTEVTRYLNVTNCSPLTANYKWSFLVDRDTVAVFKRNHSKDNSHTNDRGLDLASCSDSDVIIACDTVPRGVEQANDYGATATTNGAPANPALSEAQSALHRAAVGEQDCISSSDWKQKLQLDVEGSITVSDNKKDIASFIASEHMDTAQRAVDDWAFNADNADNAGIETPLLNTQEPIITSGSDISSSVNPILAEVLASSAAIQNPGIEEVFDILPIYGSLKPGEAEQMTLTFYGHNNIISQVKAICEVEGGPSYELELKGRASLVNYKFHSHYIDYGRVMYDQVHTGEVVIFNTGDVGFTFNAVGMDNSNGGGANADGARLKPSVPIMQPSSGFIDPGCSVTALVKLLPGSPRKFKCLMPIQIAHFVPDVVTITGEGAFPRITLDLPRKNSDVFSDLLNSAKLSLLQQNQQLNANNNSDQIDDLMQRSNNVITSPTDLEIQMEVERLLICQISQENESKTLAYELQNPTEADVLTIDVSTEPSSSKSTLKTKKKKQQQQGTPEACVQLPEYRLDFGHVILGAVGTYAVRATNTGWFPASFKVESTACQRYGFTVQYLNKVKNLPGAPHHETIDFVIQFDPRSVNLSLGPVTSSIVINISTGPQIVVELCADVTMPDLCVSSDIVDFSEVICGQAKVVTVQLHNHGHVTADWSAACGNQKDRSKSLQDFTPMHLRKRSKAKELKSKIFESMPSSGTLTPGQRQNIQVKFSPSEQKTYEQLMIITLAQSSRKLTMLCQGEGLEPHIEFDKNMLSFGPVLPHSAGDEKEVIIKNPCNFPIEIYNLEFDPVYLEEENILRLMKGYDEFNNIPLPPRNPSDKLPQELLDFYDEYVKKVEIDHKEEKLRLESKNAENECNEPTNLNIADDISKITADTSKLESETDKQVGDLEEVSPVSAAIARHLGIDLSLEGRAARNRCGIAIIVHGAPVSGKTSTAIQFATYYGITLLTIDEIVRDAIKSASTPSSRRARDLCIEAARKRDELIAGHRDGAGGPSADDNNVSSGQTQGLSVEQVNAHTSNTGLLGTSGGGQSTLVSNRKPSSMFDSKSIKPGQDKHNLNASKLAAISSDGNSQMDSTPQPLTGPVGQYFSFSGGDCVEDSVQQGIPMLSVVLPPQLLVDIISERLMMVDCQRGIVFDSLDTLFAQNAHGAVHAVLRALNNRRHIYMVTLRMQYQQLKDKQRLLEEAKVIEMEKELEIQKQKINDMSEEEYDALTESDKFEVDRKRLSGKKEKLRRELKDKQEKERIEREAQEAELRRIEEEKANKKKRRPDGGAGTSLAASAPAPTATGGVKTSGAPGAGGGTGPGGLATIPQGGKPGTQALPGAAGNNVNATLPPGGKKDGNKEGSLDRPDSSSVVRSDSASDDKKKKSAKDKKEASTKKDEDVVHRSDSELILLQRFKTFEYTYKDICDLLDQWERTIGIQRPASPIEGGEGQNEDVNHSAVHPPSGRRTKKHKQDKNDVKEKAKDTECLLVIEDTDQANADSPQTLTMEEKKQKKLDNGIGIPHYIIESDGNAVGDLVELQKASNQTSANQTSAARSDANRSSPGANTTPILSTPTHDLASSVGQLFVSQKLPALDEILNGLGLGINGPAIPPPATFAMVPYPVIRMAPPSADIGHYCFIASTLDDPNIATATEAEKLIDEEHEVEEKVATPTKEETPTKTNRSKGKSNADAKSTLDDKKSKEAVRKTSARGVRAGSTSRRVSSVAASHSPPPVAGSQTPISEHDVSSTEINVEGRMPKLTSFRWVVPAGKEVVLKLRFASEQLGQFDQTLNFELVGTRRRYQLYCRGTCAFPTISREPRVVFKQRKKNKAVDEIIHKKYILSNEMYEFGPLLVGTSREKYKDNRYIANSELLTIENTSPMEADIVFCFLKDCTQEVFLLDPPNMLLKSGESQTLNVWAFPRTPGAYTDSLVCCVKENPEPIIFKISAHGVRPELELDKKVLHFEKILIHRKDTKTLFLRNTTLLPVQWRLGGLDTLTDDFSVSQESGIIEPNSEFQLHAYFRALKAVTTTKKAIRLEVSDIDNIMGLVQTETIMIYAEAYDVALDMSFPKGVDGGIDFDTMRVNEEQKQVCTLKNKGKYDIAYVFSFEPNEHCNEETLKMFSVQPQKGILSAVDRPVQVQVSFKSTCETVINDQPILRCKVIDGDGGEAIASIPIKLSVKSVYSKYKITPSNDINFGPILVNSKKVRTFILENKGEKFEFKYTISKFNKDVDKKTESKTIAKPQAQRVEKLGKSRDGSSSGRSGPVKRKDQDASGAQALGNNQARLLIGPFTVSPAFGFILPGGQQVITVECIAETSDKFDEMINIDVMGRDPLDKPEGISYRLLCEACLPSIKVDMANMEHIYTLFEEQRVVKHLSKWLNENKLEYCGVYGVDENRFVFNNVLVGTKCKMRIKIVNNNRVPCDVIFSIRQVAGQTSTGSNSKSLARNQTDVFDVEPSREQIQAHSFLYAVVTFTPPSMQTFNALFEAQVDTSAIIGGANQKTFNLNFDITGEGNLPRINITEPTLRNKRGQPLLLFKRVLIGRKHVLKLTLANDGSMICKVDIDLVDPDGTFNLKAFPGFAVLMNDPDNPLAIKRPHTASVTIDVGDSISFEVIACPKIAQRSQAIIRVGIVNNQYEDSLIQLVAEGYEDTVSIENIRNDLSKMAADPNCYVQTGSNTSMLDNATLNDNDNNVDDIQAAKCNLIEFGDCFINKSKNLSFSLSNHSESQIMRFVWAQHNCFKISPQIGHLHAGKTKDFSISFKSSEPVSFEEMAINCCVSKIQLQKNDVSDWDDKLRSIRWIDVNKTETIQSTTDISSKPESKDGKNVPQQIITAPVQTIVPIRPSKRKVVETEIEPKYIEMDNSSREIALLVNLVADYCKVKCSTEKIHFKQTLMLQNRTYEFTLTNKGTINMAYCWKFSEASSIQSPKMNRSVTFIESPTARDQDGVNRVLVDKRGDTTIAARARAGAGGGGGGAGGGCRGGGGGGERDEMMVADCSYQPFSVAPSRGTLCPGRKQTFVVKFSPLDIHKFETTLSCKIENLDPECNELSILVKGESLMPYCHFDIPGKESDYLSSARRNPELPGPNGSPAGTSLNANTKVIEFDVLGVGVDAVRRFYIINPTETAFSFKCINDDHLVPKQRQHFRCLTPSGVIKRGKRAEIVFEYSSTGIQLKESFWHIVITMNDHQEDISIPFLLVSVVRDPQIAFDRPHLHFGSILIGHETTKTVILRNNEDIDLPFNFLDSSLHSNLAKLSVEPKTGSIKAHSEMEISLTLSPNSDKEVNLNLQCQVKRKSEKLILNVKCDGYAMDVSVLCENNTGQNYTLSNSKINELDFGQIDINETIMRKIQIINLGQFHFDYDFSFTNPSANQPDPKDAVTSIDSMLIETYNKDNCISVSPCHGTIQQSSKATCQISYCPRKSIKTISKLALKISNGPTCRFRVCGQGNAPGISFTFNSHDFGHCFIYHAGLAPVRKCLVLTNNSLKEISVNCLYQSTDHLSHDFKNNIILPGHRVNVHFDFIPRAAKRYRDEVIFQINGITNSVVTFTGHGIQLQLDLVEPKHKMLKLGTIQINQRTNRSVPIVNNTAVPITFHVVFMPSNAKLLSQKALKVSPSHEITLLPNQKINIELSFMPLSRINYFTEEVMIESSGLMLPLFMVSGACHGLEVSLETNSMPFGAVVLKSSYTRRLIMHNTGDIGAKFEWNVEKFAPDFSISPTSGYIAAQADIPFQLQFHPKTISSDIRYDNLKCKIEGKKIGLPLTLTGMCVAISPVKEVLHFQAAVRCKDVRSLMIPNRSGANWRLQPVFEGIHWQAAEYIDVEAGSTKPYDITYRPLTMTSSDKKHLGTIFLPLPDGTGLLYNMQGISDQPKANSRITRDVPCKTGYTEILSVNNWLKQAQRFNVRIEWIRPDKPDPGTTIEGLRYIDVAGNSKREYRLSFFANKESQPQIKVIFTNENTNEYQYFEIQFRAGRPGILNTFKLLTPVRQILPYQLTLENPLNVAVTFVPTCTCPELQFPQILAIPAQSQGIFLFEYLPLKVGETTVRLELNSHDLGLYIYELMLTATMPGPEQAVYCRANLGCYSVHQAKFLNYAKQKCDYTCKIDNSEFHIDKTIAAAPGSSAGIEVSIDLTYEPSQIGDTQATLTLTSPVGGDYTIPLFGTCLPSKPQGPFIVKAGSSSSVNFRNVFAHTTTFLFQIDNPLFHVTKPSEAIRAHKDHRIIVGFDGSVSSATSSDSSARPPVMARLIVSCARSAGGKSNAQWVYYLKGINT